MGAENLDFDTRCGWAQAALDAVQCLMEAEGTFTHQIAARVEPHRLSEADFETTLQVRISALEGQGRSAPLSSNLTRLSPPRVAEQYEIEMSLRRRRTPID